MQSPVYAVLGVEPRALWMLVKHSTNPAPALAQKKPVFTANEIQLNRPPTPTEGKMRGCPEGGCQHKNKSLGLSVRDSLD